MCQRADAIRDALALIEAVHRRDGEAVQVLLDHGDDRLQRVALATIAEGLVADLAEWNEKEPADLLSALREWDGGDG